MSDPLLFDTTSPRFSLPLLFAGQAQKEAFHNEAMVLVDGLIHCAIEGTASTPPGSPANGAAWLVGPSPTGSWAGHAGALALYQNGNWLFVQPRDGMSVQNRENGHTMRFWGQWRNPVAPAEPSGGSVVDSEARAAIQQLLVSLRGAGVFADD